MTFWRRGQQCIGTEESTLRKTTDSDTVTALTARIKHIQKLYLDIVSVSHESLALLLDLTLTQPRS